MPHLQHDFREKIFPLLYFITDQVSLGHLLISALELVIGTRIGLELELELILQMPLLPVP